MTSLPSPPSPRLAHPARPAFPPPFPQRHTLGPTERVIGGWRLHAALRAASPTSVRSRTAGPG